MEEARHKSPHTIPFIWNVQNMQICRDRGKLVFTRGWGVGKGRNNGFPFEVMKMFGNFGSGHTTLNPLKATDVYILNG